MTNGEVAALLIRIADLLEMQGENPFKLRAYREAARQIADLTTPIADTWRAGQLREIPGVGAAIAAKVAEYLETGRLAFLENLEAAVPPALLTLRQVPGLGPRTAKDIYDALGITTIDALEAAARTERLRTVPGIKARTEENILQGIEVWRRRYGRILLGHALPVAGSLLEWLRALPQVLQAEAAGSLRRRAETVGDLDLLVTTADPQRVMEAFVRAPEAAQVLAAGPTKASIRAGSGLQVDLRVVEANAFGAALQYFTGSQAHNVQVRAYAERRGLKVNEYGVYTTAGDRVAGATEEEVYGAVGLPWIPPELREAHGELAAAERGELPPLAAPSDLQGDLRLEVSAATTEEEIVDLAWAAHARGYAYVVLTSPVPADGEAQVLRESLAVRLQRCATRLPELRILVGAAVELRPDGTPAARDPVRLEAFDWIIGLAPRAEGAQVTRCLLGAIASQRIDVLADPLGRRAGEPQPGAPDMQAVIQAAASAGVALEVDGRPDRLDLNDAWCRRARDGGAALALSSVATSAAGLGSLDLALGVARRGWCRPSDLLNTLPPEALVAWRARRGAGSTAAGRYT